MHLQRRDASSSQSKTTATIAIVVIVVTSICLGLFTYVMLREVRKRHTNPRFVPTRYLKRKWTDWTIGKSDQSKETYSPQLQDNASVPTLRSGRGSRGSTRTSASVSRGAELENADVSGDTAAAATAANVNRNNSVRSVMTLPPYSQMARETEQILAREGERDGVDVVVEPPETLDEQEERRESEMEALFRIREQRRREIANRERRRRERTEALARGDRTTLQRLAHESAFQQSVRETRGTLAMMRDFRALSRDRRVSSVSYADVGVARHDGTRIRADSGESSRPLLDLQANRSENTVHTSHSRSRSSFGSSQRNHSSSSILGPMDAASSEPYAPPYGHSGDDYDVVVLNRGPSHSRASSRVRSVVGSETAVSVHQGEPPLYDGFGFEDAPPYHTVVSNAASQRASGSASVSVSPSATPSPTRHSSESSSAPHSPTHFDSGAPLLPRIDRLPTIRIADASSDEPVGDATSELSHALNDTAAQQA